MCLIGGCTISACNSVAGLEGLRYDGTGGTPGGQGGGAGGGGAGSCSDADCTAQASECETCSCLEGIVCDCDALAFGAACSNGYCDSDGGCVECLDDANFPCLDQSSNCEAKHCVSASCSDGEVNGGETGLDCGGPCAPCNNGEACATNDDCQSALCTQLVCSACNVHADCGTDRYCEGGLCAPRKGPFEACVQDYECLSGSCACIGSVCGCST